MVRPVVDSKSFELTASVQGQLKICVLISNALFCLLCGFNLQVLAYLLISASSSAATRVDDWQSNWGKDEFTEMATASVSMAFLAFVAFALSSLISGYNLCTHDSA